uniref:Tripartite motif containing 35-13 n=1 Tax=Mola mola TaxID=94237 RepID=A0A3Q3VL19_MOLML
MAGRLSLPEVDLSCPICCDIFTEPVVLKCSHSFCAPCLHQYWRSGLSRDCPLCRRESMDEPVPSLTLRNLCESYVEDREEGEALRDAAGGLYCDPGDMCPLHGERLKLFCVRDQEPICVVCHTSRKHKQHECCPVSEAVLDVKEKMKSALSSLQDKREALEKTKKNCDEAVAVHLLQVQARFVEQRTHEEFEKLHAFLRAEEEARMQALKREEEQKSEAIVKKAEEINREITSLSESIGALEEELALEGISVLHVSMAPGALIDVAKYVGSLAFHVWEKMQKLVKYTPVTLDPNSAAPWLILSSDLTTVCDGDERQKLPDNPERYDPDTGVLGREGFVSGKHSWEVSVGNNSAWVVGVAKASVQRKDKVSSVMKNGYLCVYFYHKMYFAGTSPLTRLNPKRNPQKIRVLLDCDRGKLSFSDPDDNTHIYTFKHTITEMVFPYFWVGCQQCPLAVEPVEFSIKLDQYC